MEGKDNYVDSYHQLRYKIIFVGNAGTGKTSILTRFMNNTFKDEYNATIGIDYFTKTLRYRGNSIKLQFWDTAGMEKYKALIPSYIKGASLIFLVYDITSNESFEGLKGWVKFITNNLDNKDIKIIIFGNKKDLELTREIKYEAAEEYANENRIPIFEVSAKTSENLINSLYHSLIYLDIFDPNYNVESLIDELIEENNEDLYSMKDKQNESTIHSKDLSKISMDTSNNNFIQEYNEKKKKCNC